MKCKRENCHSVRSVMYNVRTRGMYCLNCALQIQRDCPLDLFPQLTARWSLSNDFGYGEKYAMNVREGYFKKKIIKLDSFATKMTASGRLGFIPKDIVQHTSPEHTAFEMEISKESIALMREALDQIEKNFKIREPIPWKVP